MLHSIEKVQQLITAGRRLLLAGSSAALSQLPAGQWIGGSICYFMDQEGGVCTEDRIFVTELPNSVTGMVICNYEAHELQKLYDDAPENGFTFLLIPADAPFVEVFATDGPHCEGFLLKPMVGWVTGVPLAEIGKTKATVVDGRTHESSSGKALAMHVSLSPDVVAELNIVNIFKPSDGDTITFPESTFCAGDCLVNGMATNLAEYVCRRSIDTRLPLTADYCGSIVNVALKSVDMQARTVSFYGSVVAGVEYRFAAPVQDYAESFAKSIPQGPEAEFSCNCILNYLYGELDGKRTGSAIGPVTFGEIAHLLLSQTLVQLRIHQIGGTIS